MKSSLLMPGSLILLIALLISGLAIAADSAAEDKDTAPPLLGGITELSELVVLQVPVSELRTTKISGYLGSIRCLLLAHGDVELGVDLDKARFEDVNPSKKTATLVLPEPTTRRARLDHKRTTVYRIDRTGLWRLLFTDTKATRLVNKAMIDAQAAVELVGQDEKLKDQARQRAEVVIHSTMEVGGWQVNITWAE